MTQCSVGNKITGFGVSHLGSNVHLLICDFRQVIKCLGASVFSSLRCDANTYLIGMLWGLNELNCKVHGTVHIIKILSAHNEE